MCFWAVALADGAEAETGGVTAEGDLRVWWSDTAMAGVAVRLR